MINNQFGLTLIVAPSLPATSQVKQHTGRSPGAPDCQPAAGSASKNLEPEFLSITMSAISLSLSLPLLSYFLSMCTAVYVLLSQAKKTNKEAQLGTVVQAKAQTLQDKLTTRFQKQLKKQNLYSAILLCSLFRCAQTHIW